MSITEMFKSGPYWGALAILVIGLTFFQSGRLRQLQDETASGLTAEQLAQAESLTQSQLALWKESPSFGFNNLIADWAFLQFLQYFGDDEVRNKIGYRLSPDYFEAIIPRDPYYTPFYLFLSGSSSIYGGQPDRAVALMNEGLSHMTPSVPNDGYLVWRYKGTDELLFLGDAEAARQSFQTAADWARQSTDPQAAVVAEASQRTAEFLANNPISKRAQIDAWASILTSAFDEQTRNLAIERIEGLGGQVEISEAGGVRIRYPEGD